MAKQKIADLPQEEQEKLISEMKELGIGGVYATYTVEKALAAIAKKKESLNDDSEDAGADETPEETDEENAEETEEPGDDEVTEENSDAPEDEETEDGETDEETPDEPEETEEEPENETPETPEPETPKKERKFNGLCHICRSKVYDGVCSGCGFKLRG